MRGLARGQRAPSSPSASAKPPTPDVSNQKLHIWITQKALVFESELWAELWESPGKLFAQLDVIIAVT